MVCCERNGDNFDGSFNFRGCISMPGLHFDAIAAKIHRVTGASVKFNYDIKNKSHSFANNAPLIEQNTANIYFSHQ